MATPFPTQAAPDCEVSVLARYKRESPAVQRHGALIAVSASFSCYALRNGLIRAIHTESEASTLLRGLGSDVADMRFCRGEELIAAVSKTGVVLAWRLTVAGDAVEAEVVLSHTPLQPPADPASPCLALFASASLLVTHVSGSGLQLWRLGSSEQAEPCASADASDVSAIGFSEGRDALVVGCASGEAYTCEGVLAYAESGRLGLVGAPFGGALVGRPPRRPVRPLHVHYGSSGRQHLQGVGRWHG